MSAGRHTRDGYVVGHQLPHISDPTPGKPRGGVRAALCMPSQPHTEAHGPSPHHSLLPPRFCRGPVPMGQGSDVPGSSPPLPALF